MYLIIMEGNYGVVDADDSSCHGYYIIKFSSSPYTLQADLIICGQNTSSGEMVRKGNDLFSINNNSHYYILQKINTITQFFSKENNQRQWKRNIL